MIFKTIIFVVVASFVALGQNPPRFVIFRGYEWVKCCNAFYDNDKLICPANTTDCEQTTEIIEANNTCTVSGFIRCLDESDAVLKTKNFTKQLYSFYHSPKTIKRTYSSKIPVSWSRASIVELEKLPNSTLPWIPAQPGI